MPERGSHRESHDEVCRVARESYGRVVALLARRTRDLAAAEDAINEGFRRALETWPRDGVPDRPEAWIVTVARRAMLDRVRRTSRETPWTTEIEHVMQDIETGRADIPDERLELLFVCAHPALDVAVRTPLMLQCVLGVDAERIASAYLVPTTTMSQRLVRAKTKIKDAGLRFGLPEESEWQSRLGAVMDAVYVAFTCGWEADDGATGGGELSREAVDLGRAVTVLVPQEAEPQGLAALMLYVQSRVAARHDNSGKFVPLDEQNVDRWSVPLIREAESRLKNASTLRQPGRFVLEAAIQSAHVDRRVNGVQNWEVIVRMYDHLVQMEGSVGAAIARAAALVQAGRSQDALRQLDELNQRARDHQPYWVVRGRASAAAGLKQPAREAYAKAIALSRPGRIREYVEAQCAALDGEN